MHAIDVGLPGTSMPGWGEHLPADDRRAVLAYIKTFSSFFEGATPQALELGGAPGGGDEALRIGRLMYDSIGCAKCHGQAGRGDGPSASELDDDFGNPMLAADLSEHWRFNAGGTVEDIYRTLRTGLDGTPMPSFSDLIDQQYLTDKELWHLAQYVRSLSPEKPPRLRDVIIAAKVDTVATTPDDSAWADADEFWFPLVGQIIRKSRWFNPAVTGVYVRAMHDGERIAVRVAWHDRSESPSPDPDWQAYARKVLASVSVDDAAPPVAQPWPDQIAVQFPRRIPSAMERPYFLMGSGTDPVYQWRWRSQPRGGEEGTARGLERYDAHTGEGERARTCARRPYSTKGSGESFSRALLPQPTPPTTFSSKPVVRFPSRSSPGTARAASTAAVWPSAAGTTSRSQSRYRRQCSSRPLSPSR
jgi:mono/diheme cytochrome c family protein